MPVFQVKAGQDFGYVFFQPDINAFLSFRRQENLSQRTISYSTDDKATGRTEQLCDPLFGHSPNQLRNTDGAISCLFMSLPVCERFRPFGVCSALLKLSSAGMSDDDCMEAELGAVREKRAGQNADLRKKIAPYFTTLSLVCLSGRW